MGLPVEKLVVATNENDILDRFWKSGHYEKHPVHGRAAEGGLAEDGAKAHPTGVKETLSPAMDILVSSNFERLLWFLAHERSEQHTDAERRAEAGAKVKTWLMELKTNGGFGVEAAILSAAKKDFESERVSDVQTLETIQQFYSTEVASNASTGEGGYVLDPHSAIGVAASLRSLVRAPPPTTHHVALATAHPAKFANAVDEALKREERFSFESILPEQFVGLERRERRVRVVEKGKGWQGVRDIIGEEVAREGMVT
jgi:threonine synthase